MSLLHLSDERRLAPEENAVIEGDSCQYAWISHLPAPLLLHTKACVCAGVHSGLFFFFFSFSSSVLSGVDLCVSQVSVIRIASRSHQGEPLISHLA